MALVADVGSTCLQGPEKEEAELWSPVPTAPGQERRSFQASPQQWGVLSEKERACAGSRWEAWPAGDELVAILGMESKRPALSPHGESNAAK